MILCRQQKETASKQPCKEKMKQENLEPERKRCHMENIGAIITSYRKKAHMSQIELAKKLEEEGIEVSPKSVSAWCEGINKFDIKCKYI